MFITFMGSTSRAGICVACLKLTTLGRRIVNRLYYFWAWLKPPWVGGVTPTVCAVGDVPLFWVDFWSRLRFLGSNFYQDWDFWAEFFKNDWDFWGWSLGPRYLWWVKFFPVADCFEWFLWAGFRWCDLSGRFFWIHDILLYEIESVRTWMSKFE